MKNKFYLIGVDILSLSLSLVLSQYFSGLWFDKKTILYIYFLSLIIKIFFFARLGLYHAILRFAGFFLARAIIRATIIASILIFAIASIFFVSPLLLIKFSCTDYLLSTFLIALSRFAPRYLAMSKNNGNKNVLIYGAGELGDHIARIILTNPGEINLVGFIDDDKSKIGKRLHNLIIYGPSAHIESILDEKEISEIIVAIAGINGEHLREITRKCRNKNIFCRTVSPFPSMLKKEANIKNIDIADLLKRSPRDLDESQILRFISGKNIMITGAGGTIGTEIVKQCLRFKPRKLILVDHSEYNIYSLQEALSNSIVPISYHLVNVIDNLSMDNLFRKERPNLVLHAAAYKHVPIVEENPREAIRNNILGTIITSNLCDKYNVEKFVFISTDKAVRPTSIMGATKRIAELYIQNFDKRSNTKFVAVRFGNVLGSSGSVIPKFIQQINEGGPVTVTHPEVTRYFMLVSEAVQLVLQASSIGEGGEIFILNMGKPVKIAEMAEDLIFISGSLPHKDIKIRFTGLRPGEKLYEELLIDETEKRTQYENITIARTELIDWQQLNNDIELLFNCIEFQKFHDIISHIKQLVPEFIHADLDKKSRLSSREENYSKDIDRSSQLM